MKLGIDYVHIWKILRNSTFLIASIVARGIIVQRGFREKNVLDVISLLNSKMHRNSLRSALLEKQ